PVLKIELDQHTYEALIAVALREWRPTQWQAEMLLRKAIRQIGLASQSVKHYLDAFAAFCQWCVWLDYLPIDPLVRRTRVQVRPRGCYGDCPGQSACTTCARSGHGCPNPPTTTRRNHPTRAAYYTDLLADSQFCREGTGGTSD